MEENLMDIIYKSDFDINKFMEYLINNKNCENTIRTYLFNIINALNKEDIYFFCIKDIDGYKKFISDNIIELLSQYMKKDIVKICYILNNDLDIFTNNLDKLYNELDFDIFAIILNFIKDKLTDEQLDKIYSDKHKIIYDSINYITVDVDEKEKESLIELIIKLIDEICAYEKTNWKDIYLAGFGCFSNVYAIGDKVIKLGTRLEFNIPYTKYLVKPLIRYNFADISENNNLVVEVTERLDTTEKIPLEEMYNIHIDLDDNGVTYNDIKEDNFGKLIKDNKIYWNKPLGNYNGVYGENGNEILTKGSYAIADSDLLYRKNKNSNYNCYEVSMLLKRVKEKGLIKTR